MSKEIILDPNQDQKIGHEKIRKYLEAMNLLPNLSKGEADQFIEIAQAYGLNPFKREIYASKYGSNFSIIVGFETYIKRAERSGRLSGWHVTTSGSLNESDLSKSQLKAIITIHRKDWDHPFIHEVWFSEYAQKTKEGYLNKFWKEKPITMIKKVAMAQGFRLCFSDELGGLPYTSEEIGAMDQISIPAIIQEPEIKPEPESSQISETGKSGKISRKPKSSKEEPKIISTATPIKIEIPENQLQEEFQKICIQIDLAQSIDDLKTVYEKFKGWQKDGEFLGRLSYKRKEIEAIEAEMKKKMEEAPSIEEAMNQESGSSLPNPDQIELF